MLRPHCVILFFAAATALCGCNKPAATQDTVVATAASTTAVTFNHDVAPIIFANCACCHHPGEAAPFSLLTYERCPSAGEPNCGSNETPVYAAVVA